MAQLKLTIDCLTKICRTCLSTECKLKGLKQNEELVSLLTRWSFIQVNLCNLLPKQICVLCISKLNLIYNFVQTCARAEIELLKAIENDRDTLLPYLEALPDPSDSNSDDESDGDEDSEDSFTLDLPADDLFECEDTKLKIEKDETPETDDDLSRIKIANVQSIPDEAMSVGCSDSLEINLENDGVENSIFKGFNREEIQLTRSNLERYTQALASPSAFFESIKFKCFLCGNKVNLSCEKDDIRTLQFSTLNDDAHVLCKKRIKVLRDIIKDLYVKQDELSALNTSWQKIFLQGAERNDDGRVAQLPTNPVNANPTKPHEIGFRKDGQVHLGHLTWIPETDFERAFRYSLNPNKFLINMALTLFGAETLAKSTITGISKHGVKKEPLNTIRMCALKSSLKYYMREYNVPDYYQKYIWKNFNKILGQKITQITTEYKKRCFENSAAENDNKRGKN